MGKCEDAMGEKEKDVAYLKFNIHELKKSFNEKEKEVELLKVKNINIEKEMNLMKDQSQETRKNFEKEVDMLTLKNLLFESKIDSLGKEILESKKLLEDKQVEIIEMKLEIEEFNNNKTENICSSQKREDEVKQLEKKASETNNEVKTKRNLIEKSTNRLSNEINDLTARITTAEEAIKYNFTTLNDKVSEETESMKLLKYWQKDVHKKMENIGNIEGHVTNIENILFCDSPHGSKVVLLQWKLQNYQYHFEIGERVCSPIFLTQIKGYCFKLFVQWIGEKKEYLGLFLKVCRGSNYDKPLEPLKIPFTLEMVDNKGNILSRKVPLSDIETFREECFTLPPGQNQCKMGWGSSQFLSMPDLNNYILNDMLSIQCRLTPS